MKSVNLLGIAGLVLGFATMAFAQAPAVELKVGDKAPNFKLQGSDGKTYNLADFAGKKAVVVAWFPAAFTKGVSLALSATLIGLAVALVSIVPAGYLQRKIDNYAARIDLLLERILATQAKS